MKKITKIATFLVCACFSLLTKTAIAQTKIITGIVKDEKGIVLVDALVVAKGTGIQSITSDSGTFSISVPSTTQALEISHVGFTKIDLSLTSETYYSVTLKNLSVLDEVVVVGYGTVKKKDLTGAVASVGAKDFNQGIVTAPDQLIQGKVAGLEITTNSGQPGAATTVRIRGNSSIRTGSGQPLYVIDGVPLDGRNARPKLNIAGVGQTADSDPLLFINPNDIASMDVLKDASATAIYGSRGANGVIMITTKKGKTNGLTSLDAFYSVGISKLAKRYNVLSGPDYRSALSKYKIKSGDYGNNVDAQSEIVRTAVSQNANVAMSGGNENSNYRLSLGYMDNQGIILKSDLKKYMASMVGQFNYWDKRFKIDYNVSVTHTTESIAPISNDAGFTGSMVGNALSWNPTQALKVDTSSGYNQLDGGLINPLAMSAATNDIANITSAWAYIAPSFKILKNLDYRFLYSINYQDGIRRTSEASWLLVTNIIGRGWASYENNELTTQLLTHTLNYNQSWGKLDFTALGGYEYQKFAYKGNAISGQDFTSNVISYENIMQNASQASLITSSFMDPSASLQSYFGRATFNYDNRYLLTGTFRADGSSKFGSNNRYGYFPSFAVKWNLINEGFMKGTTFFSNLAFRAGYGVTGSQDFPSGAAQSQYQFNQGGNRLINVENPDLKWETAKQLNLGVDFAILNNRLYGSVDYFHKNTSNLLFNTQVTLPGPATKFWINLPANIYNKGVEISLGSDLVRSKDLKWDMNVNAAFLNNKVKNYNGPLLLTGQLSGPGMTTTYVQTIANNQPLNVFYTKKFMGFDSAGQARFSDNGKNILQGNPNPKVLLGFRTSVQYKSWMLNINMNGVFGNQIYNNTANSILPISNLGTRNVDARVLNTTESVTDGITPSSRYLESGSYMRLTNATLGYSIGDLANRKIKNLKVFFTGQNLFTITKYSGFSPEVNTDKSGNTGLSSQGIEFVPYPTARTFILGVNVSL